MIRVFLVFIFIFSSLFSLSAEELFSRPVIIGASVSDGYEHTERLGGPRSDALALDQHLCKITNLPVDRFSNFSQRFCFLHPLVSAHQQMSHTLETKPTVFIAIDQLFWQLYGNFASSEQRIITFRAALIKLDPITCPLVIGNIPDASLAIGKMLSASQVPDQKTINQANQLLNEWVKNRKQTAIIDLASFMQLCAANKEIKLKNIIYPAGSTKKFLQTDMLHPTASGVSALSHAIIDSLQSISDVKDEDLNLKFDKTADQGR
jgi:hypothetical protein